MKISTLLICIFSIFAIILNIEGSNCIVQISSLPQSNNSSNNNEDQSNNSEFSNQQAERQLQPLQQQEEEEEVSQSQETLIQQQQQQSYELLKYCFLVTNLYVYSLFGVIIGCIILVLWYVRYKKIWSGRKKGSIT